MLESGQMNTTTRPELALVTGLYRTTNAIVRELDQRLGRDHNVTFIQAVTLLAVDSFDRPQPHLVADYLSQQSQTVTGVLDRFRTLPMWRGSVLVGRTLADAMAAVLCSTFVVLTGLAIGWRPDGPLQVLGGVALAVLFSHALSWACACLGLLSESPESATAIAFLVVFPMAFLSNAFSPTQGMPDWLRPIAEWNPVSALASACRTSFGDPNPGALSRAWPMQHPVLASLLWSIAIIAVFAPLAARLLVRRLTD